MPPEVTSGTIGLLAGEDQVMELGPIYYKGNLSKYNTPIIKVRPSYLCNGNSDTASLFEDGLWVS